MRSSIQWSGPLIWRSLSPQLKNERIVWHNLIVVVGTLVAGMFGVAFQSLVSHQFRPADYGAVFAVVTLITFIGLPAGAFTLLMARETSRGRASGQLAGSAALLRGGNRALLLCGFALTAVMILGSSFLSAFLAIPTGLVLAAAIGMPFALALPLLFGQLQGEQRFGAFTFLLTGQAALKLIAAIALGVVWGPVGVIAGISAATIVAYVTAWLMLRPRLSIKPNLSWWRPAAAYLGVVVPSSLSLAALLSADVLLVKHYFPTQAAGEYAAVAAIGRAIFWGASGIAVVLFPKVIHRATLGKRASPVIVASLLLVAVGGLTSLVVLFMSSRWLITAFAGASYAGAAGYLPWYSLGMTLMGGVAVLVATHQTRGKPGFLAILVPLTLLEGALLTAFHQSLSEVVLIVDVSMALILAALGALYLMDERRAPATSTGQGGNP